MTTLYEIQNLRRFQYSVLNAQSQMKWYLQKYDVYYLVE